MAIEIERKFLVNGSGWRQVQGVHIIQGYLNRDQARTVRVRMEGEKAFLTVKGLTTGAARAEFEYPIPNADGKELLKLCEPPTVEKTRRRIHEGGMVWEVDEFLEENAGLIVAEIELQSEEQSFTKPAWLGEEVTQDPRYFNSMLAEHPYSTWEQEQPA